MKVTDKRTMLQLQGDKVLVVVEDDEFIFTIVRFIDGNHHELQLVNRGSKVREELPLTQAALDNMVRIKHQEAQWKLVL